MKHFTVAIDGPAGSGKSSVAEEAARLLHVLHLDTGAMYRAFALCALQAGVPMADKKALARLARRVRIDARFEGGRQRTLANGRDVTDLIRTPEVSRAASDVAVQATVRRMMVRRQRRIAARQSMVLDGRDTGTRVLPHATLKVYLTASCEVRARRRLAELTARGVPADYDTVLADVTARDLQDTTRRVDPLTVAPGAVVLDTGDMTIPAAAQAILQLLERKRMGTGNAAKAARREPFTFFYRAAIVASRFLFTWITPVTYHHEERALMDAPFILIGNHDSMIDPLLVGWKCPWYQIRYLGKAELTKNPLMRAMYKNMLMIPVNRHNMDMKAVRACLKTLEEGHVLGIFPEGTRHKKTLMEEMESGVAMIALRSGVPILPVFIASKPRPFKRVHCYYGEPFVARVPAQGGVNREAVEAVMADITARYRAMAQAHAASAAR